MSIGKSVYTQVVDACHERGWTLTQLGEKLDMNANGVAWSLAKHRIRTNPELLTKLSAILGTSIVFHERKRRG